MKYHSTSSVRKQIIICLIIVALLMGVFYSVHNVIGYRVIALLMLFSISLLAMYFDMIPLLVSASTSALVWNFFFIPPRFTFLVNNPEDTLIFLMYFVIALLNAVLTSKIREQELKVRDKEEKEATIELYSTIINSLSHELKTPIATILGTIDTLQEENYFLSDKAKKELYTEIDKAGVRLNEQVVNLLDINRIDAGIIKPKMDWCDLSELIHTIINKLEIQHRKIVFNSYEEFPLIWLDSGLIEQAMGNVLKNAINYTPDYSTIRIENSYVNGILIINISDSGFGIPQVAINKIFDKFYRLPHSKPGGTGLGLAITKGFIEAHSGTIIAKNNEVGGVTFVITIPTQASYINNLKNE